MPTTHTQTASPAAEAPRAEAALLAELAGSWRQSDHPDVWAVLPGREVDMVGFYDPKDDLDRLIDSLDELDL